MVFVSQCRYERSEVQVYFRATCLYSHRRSHAFPASPHVLDGRKIYFPLPVPSGGGCGLPGQVLTAGERDGSESGAELDQTGQDRKCERRGGDAAGGGEQSAAAAAAAGARGRRHLRQHRRLLLRIPARPQTGEAGRVTWTNHSPGGCPIGIICDVIKYEAEMIQRLVD